MEDFIAPASAQAAQFEVNKDFQTKGPLYKGDSGFLRPNQHRHRNEHIDREILKTYLDSEFEDGVDTAEKLISENISPRDLASLTKKDLELIGIKNEKKIDDLLKVFSELPNQYPTYEDMCHLEKAQTYNRQIFMNASNHLEIMRRSLTAANYKVQIWPPDDVILGEKLFASRFVVKALDELDSLTNDIIFLKSEQQLEKPRPNKKSSNRIHMTTWLLLGSLSSISVLLALYYWKLK
uniref:Uncharacterized protein n=1 Tax=Glossina brevipalpis TaxID=37001 RepID=A0A1A9WEW5_9MUSC